MERNLLRWRINKPRQAAPKMQQPKLRKSRSPYCRLLPSWRRKGRTVPALVERKTNRADHCRQYGLHRRDPGRALCSVEQRVQTALAASENTSIISNACIADSGCTSYFFKSRDAFVTYNPIKTLVGQSSKSGANFSVPVTKRCSSCSRRHSEPHLN